MSGYLGSIGFAYPAAMGAWAATQEERHPLRRAGRSSPSRATAASGSTSPRSRRRSSTAWTSPTCCSTTSELGKISKEQRSGEWEVWQTSLHNPNFAEYANLCGALGIRVTEASQLDDALAEAMNHPGPSTVEILTDPELV